MQRRCFRAIPWLAGLTVLFALSGCVQFLYEPPGASFSFGSPPFYSGIEVVFDASASSAGSGQIRNYLWDFDDGGTAIGERVAHAFGAAGDYDVRLTVINSNDRETSVAHTVSVVVGMIVPTTFETIQAAIVAASDGDVIIVLPGTYTENLDFLGKAVTVRSQDPTDPTVVAATGLEGTAIDRPLVMFTHDETRTSVFEGFTVKGGHLWETRCGGAIYVREASPTIRRCVFEDHTAGFTGGAICLIESGGSIAENAFRRNRSSSGGAIAVDTYARAPSIIENVFEDNTAEQGGAIYVGLTGGGNQAAISAATVILENSFIANVATSAGGGGAVKVGFHGNVRLGDPDSNTYANNDPDDVNYDVPP